jgi:hypothetical protein
VVCYVFFFFFGKELSAKDVHKETFPVYCGKCLSRLFGPLKVHLASKRFAGDEEVEAGVRNG